MKPHRPAKLLLMLGMLFPLALTASPVVAREPSIPTMSFERPHQLQAAGEPIDLGSHVATRCVDWNADGQLDLIAAAGDGKLWLFRHVDPKQPTTFAKQEPIVAGGRDRWGNSYTGATLAHVIGSTLPDLVVAHSANQISIHENIGTLRRPRFQEKSLDLTVQQGCQGRFDIADWDGDGLPDLITGSFGGAVVWYRNQGQSKQPKFTEGQSFHDISIAYNSHPRIVDFNQDGRLDLLLGVNWGSVSLFLNDGTAKAPHLAGGVQMHWSHDGSNLSLRELNGDDTTPELVDLDQDGVLDLVSGGKNGRLFLMRGVGVSSRLATLNAALEKHGPQLTKRLSEQDELKQSVFGAMTAMQADLAGGLIPLAAREKLFQQLAPLAKKYPTLFQRQQFDLKATPFAPSFAAQYWVLMFEALPDTPAHRQQVADAINFTGGYRQLLVDLGLIFIDNNTATPEQLQVMHQLLMAMPRSVWDVETITVAGWLGDGFREQKIRSRTGVNIFDLPLGRIEDSFAGDSPRPGVTDVYMICLAHEIAHNMLDTIGRRLRPELYERKFAGLAQAAGPLVVYHTPKSRGIDMPATKAKFQAAGVWDGNNDSWQASWVAYFKGKPEFDRAYSRGNIQFFLDAPQEAFATLANQYFADSQLMLEFCKTRWDAGHKSNINQFLLIADYLSENSNKVRFYTMRPGGDLTITPATFRRDKQNRIIEVRSTKSTAHFDYDANNLVTTFTLTPNTP
ncbi:MAG: VCBS repeat-containing protein [Planctomycetaceae bacterium]